MTDEPPPAERRPRVPSTTELSAAADEARAMIEARLAGLDPELLVDLSVGLRSRVEVDASWNDSFIDRFLDGGKFSDVFINLHGVRAEFEIDDDPRFGAAKRLHE